MIRICQFVSVVLLASLASTCLADEPPPLRHNPFARPPAVVNGGDNVFAVATDSGELTLDLQATMVGSKQRLANVGGRILRTGDEVQGYVLEQVFEDRAVFRRAGETLIVYVRQKAEPDNE